MARKKREDDQVDGNPDRPWNEAQWREFLRESDLRAARYAELFETLIDDPDRDNKVAREMGWTGRGVANEQGPGHGFDDDDADGEDDADGPFAAEIAEMEEVDPNDPELRAEVARDRRALHAIPAYQLGRRLAGDVVKAMRDLEQTGDERVSEACENAMIPGAKIAGGHGIGYDDHALCGNIVCNTIALDAAKRSHGLFAELKADSVLPAPVVDDLLPKLAKLIAALEARIAELRARVTW